jgi:preprotein translocase subunit Sec61beta
LVFRCSQSLAEYLSEEEDDDDIMIAPRAMVAVGRCFFAG